MNDLWALRKEEMRSKIKESMQNPEVKEKLSELNKRPRAKMTDEHKARISDKLVGRQPSNFYSHFFAENRTHSKHGWIEIDGRKFYMRSTWERNIARYFQWLKEKGNIKEWDYEPKRFVFEKIQFGCRTYLPDFIIYENDGSHYWVEVKGRMDQKSNTKLKRMSRYFPEEKVLILDQSEYRDIKKEMKNLVDWEQDINLRRRIEA